MIGQDTRRLCICHCKVGSTRPSDWHMRTKRRTLYSMLSAILLPQGIIFKNVTLEMSRKASHTTNVLLKGSFLSALIFSPWDRKQQCNRPKSGSQKSYISISTVGFERRLLLGGQTGMIILQLIIGKEPQWRAGRAVGDSTLWWLSP